MDYSNQPQFGNQGTSLPTSTLAIVSLVAGILGFTVFPVISTAVALITGYMARKETRAEPPAASGDGMATAGIIMGWIQVGLIVLGICCFAAYFLFIVGAVATSQS
jgi:magnesium-transporting ATPase (P-type)